MPTFSRFIGAWSLVFLSACDSKPAAPSTKPVPDSPVPSSPTKEPGGPKVYTFVVRPPKVGDKFKKQGTQKVDTGPDGAPIHHDSGIDLKVEVLAIEGTHVSKVKLAYEKGKDSRDALGGNSYLVNAMVDQQPTVTDASGKTVDQKISELVIGDAGDFLVNWTGEALSDKPRYVGDVMTDVAEALEKTQGGPQEAKATVKLASVEIIGGHELANLDVSVDQTHVGPEGKTERHQTGSLKVPLDDAMTGELTLYGKGTRPTSPKADEPATFRHHVNVIRLN